MMTSYPELQVMAWGTGIFMVLLIGLFIYIVHKEHNSTDKDMP